MVPAMLPGPVPPGGREAGLDHQDACLLQRKGPRTFWKPLCILIEGGVGPAINFWGAIPFMLTPTRALTPEPWPERAEPVSWPLHPGMQPERPVNLCLGCGPGVLSSVNHCPTPALSTGWWPRGL